MSLTIGEELIHPLLVMLSLIVLAISGVAYYRRKSPRYLLLFFAFVFLFASQVVTYAQELYVGSIDLQILGLHPAHVFDLGALFSFAGALLEN
ncbi:MAG: hypothetical protein OK422_01420 [Thaumarchaeota archaeon]|nr:hypothetical protein [Nitrososphaerota archaeon]